MVMLVIELISSDTTENDEDMELVNGTKTKIVDLEEGSWTNAANNGFLLFPELDGKEFSKLPV